MRLSGVVPIYNDGYLARALCEEWMRVFGPPRGDYELIFINDGSRNDSLATLIELSKDYPFIRVIELSRNFGQHIALACGFAEAKGDIVVRMNVDMQDPPAALPRFIDEIEQRDADLVIGLYKKRRSPLKDKITSKLFFWIFHFLTGMNVPYNTSPMRAMSRRFIEAYNQLTEKSRFPQGLDVWLGFKAAYVEIEHRERVDKKSSYNFWSRLSLALTGVLYFSDRPIMIVMGFGAIASVFGFVMGITILIARLTGADYLPGYATTAVLGLLSLGIQTTSIGVVGLYVGRIFKEVQNRPLYLIRNVYGAAETVQKRSRVEQAHLLQPGRGDGARGTVSAASDLRG